MNDKYAVVTGATSGIGLQIAKGLVATGYNTIIVARDRQKAVENAIRQNKEKIMSIQQWVAIVASIVLGLVMVLQMLLALGFGPGQAAWRGQYRVLPTRLRWASRATVVVLGLAAWVMLAKAGLVFPGTEPVAVGVATWVFAGFWLLNTVGNLASRSPAERYAMTPVTLLLVVCFIVVALSLSGTSV